MGNVLRTASYGILLKWGFEDDGVEASCHGGILSVLEVSQAGTPRSQAAVLVAGIGGGCCRQVVVQARCLRTVGMESSRYSDSCVKQLLVLSHR
ncbi:hypothetical protein Droror1_Dr00028053 [Drosera rotundifolia]